MQFSDTSNKLGLIQECEDLLGFDYGDISGDTDRLDGFTRLLNEAYRLVNKKIWRYSGTWQYDDDNNSGLPYATANLKDSQEDYSLPTYAQSITRLEVKDSNGDFQVIKPFDEVNLGMAWSEFMEDDGMPEYYDVKGRQIYLKPNPAPSDVTLTAGLKVFFTRTIHAFTSSDTTATPAFDEDFHRLLPQLAAYWWAAGKDLDNTRLNAIKEGPGGIKETFDELRFFYGNRHEDVKTSIKPHGKYDVRQSI